MVWDRGVGVVLPSPRVQKNECGMRRAVYLALEARRGATERQPAYGELCVVWDRVVLLGWCAVAAPRAEE